MLIHLILKDDKKKFITMDNYTFFMLLILAIAIHNMYRLKKERDELRYKYEYLVTELLIEILRHINTSSEPSPKDERRITEE